MNPTIRPATPADVPGLLECSIALFAEDAGTRDATMNIDWPREHGEQSLRDGIADDARLVLVAEADGAVMGSLSGRLAEPSDIRPVRIATLVSMYVKPDARGNGTGSALVAAFREWAGQKAADRIAVSAFAYNESAIRFYRRNGFAPYTLTLEGDA